MKSAALAGYLDSTNLRLDATEADLRTLCADARRHEFAAVMLYPASVPLARETLASAKVRIGTVIGFPHGRTPTAAKEAEIRAVAETGAQEVDIVMHYADLREGRQAAVAAELGRLAAVARQLHLLTKVIVETCYLDRRQKLAALVLCENAGIDFIKTSTGFGAAGAAVDDVKLFADHRRGSIRIKAAGGIKTLAQAQALIAAGAERLGTSSAVALVQEAADGKVAASTGDY
ncbi:MAG: deoxyribose-phosphate aldolase [Opitutaceae bacterium]|nr:deoxyribose-phosphate aldolase [Opitutaceae bacterium]